MAPDTGPLTSSTYWESFWEQLPNRPVNPHHHYDRDVLALLQRAAGRRGDIAFMEAGCGGSMWLPYLAGTFGWEVSGMDYSPRGCEMAEAVLRAAGVKATILERDLLQAHPDLEGRFDIVYSAGLIEHFTNPVPILCGFARWLKPGGAVVTLVPNLHNPATLIQRWVGPQRLAGHRVYSPRQLAAMHVDAGFQTETLRYVGIGGMVVPDWSRPPDTAGARAYRVGWGGASRAIGALRRVADRAGGVLPHTRWTSPSIGYVGRAPE
jgi:SAM-dependent methyltransferase